MCFVPNKTGIPFITLLIGDETMYTVPDHIKRHVNKIIGEYELLYRQGHKIALQMVRGNRVYSGIETTEYCLKTVKAFRQQLNHPSGDLFSGTEEQIRRKIYDRILEFYKPLSPEAILRINSSVETQCQLDRALKNARKNPYTASDARNISWFITNGSTNNWCQTDEKIHRKLFKLVKSQEAFEKLLSRPDSTPTMEITQESEKNLTCIRIAIQVLDIPELYRKQSRVREHNAFWNGPHSVEEFDTEYTIFNMWNDVAETGIYYVYIPES